VDATKFQQPNNSSDRDDLWLRDGDVIEVPEKP